MKGGKRGVAEGGWKHAHYRYLSRTTTDDGRGRMQARRATTTTPGTPFLQRGRRRTRRGIIDTIFVHLSRSETRVSLPIPRINYTSTRKAYFTLTPKTDKQARALNGMVHGGMRKEGRTATEAVKALALLVSDGVIGQASLGYHEFMISMD